MNYAPHLPQGAHGIIPGVGAVLTKALVVATCAVACGAAASLALPAPRALAAPAATTATATATAAPAAAKDPLEKVEVPTVVEQVSSVAAAATDDPANANWADEVTVDPGATVTFKVTGTLTSLLDQYVTYYYAFACEHPAAFAPHAATAKVALLQPDGTRADVTNLFTPELTGAQLTVAAPNVLQAAGITAASQLELTYQASAPTTPGTYANYAHITYSSIYDPHATDDSVEDSVTVTVRAPKQAAKAKKTKKKNMPSTGDTVLAMVAAVAVAGVITLLVGLLSRRRKAQE